MRPRRVGTFLMSRRPTSAKLAARAMIRSTSARSRSSIASRCFIAPPPLARSRLWAALDRDLVDAVGLLEPHVDALLARGRQVLADVVGADRQLAVAAVGEHGELDALGAPVVEERVDRRPHGAAGEQHVVDEHDRAPVEVEVEVRGVDDRLRAGLAAVEVVAVEGDVEVAERDLGAGQLADQGVQPAGEHRAAGVDPDQRQRLRAGVLLDDLVRDPHERAAQIVAVEDDLLGLVPSYAPLPGLSGPG